MHVGYFCLFFFCHSPVILANLRDRRVMKNILLHKDALAETTNIRSVRDTKVQGASRHIAEKSRHALTLLICLCFTPQSRVADCRKTPFITARALSEASPAKTDPDGSKRHPSNIRQRHARSSATHTRVTRDAPVLRTRTTACRCSYIALILLAVSIFPP